MKANRTTIIPLDHPTERQADSLRQTAHLVQHCRRRTSDWAWNNPKQPEDLNVSKDDAEEALYQDLRDETNEDLHANLVQKAIKNVTDALSSLQTNWERGERISKPSWNVDEDYTLTYDKRAATFNEDHVSLATVDGRVELEYILPENPEGTPYDKYADNEDWENGQGELVYDGERYWLHLSSSRDYADELWARRDDEEVSDTPEEGAIRALAVDLNVMNYTAVTSAGGFYGNADLLNHRRTHYEKLRGELQETGTRSAYQRFQERRGIEAEWFDGYGFDVINGIVADALRVRATHVVFEKLKGILARISNEPKYQQWMYKRIREGVEEKLAPYGVEVVEVDPRDTSRGCSHVGCGHVADANRSGKEFECQKCGRSWNADYNAARNIALKYLESVPASPMCSSGVATRQLALMSGVLSVEADGASHVSMDWASTDKPTASAVGN